MRMLNMHADEHARYARRCPIQERSQKTLPAKSTKQIPKFNINWTRKHARSYPNSPGIHPKLCWGVSWAVLWLASRRRFRRSETPCCILQQWGGKKFNFQCMMFKGKFPLASDLVVTHSLRRSLFTSSSRSVIDYLLRKGVKVHEIKRLLNFLVPKIAAVTNDFLSLNL